MNISGFIKSKKKDFRTNAEKIAYLKGEKAVLVEEKQVFDMEQENRRIKHEMKKEKFQRIIPVDNFRKKFSEARKSSAYKNIKSNIGSNMRNRFDLEGEKRKNRLKNKKNYL